MCSESKDLPDNQKNIYQLLKEDLPTKVPDDENLSGFEDDLYTNLLVTTFWLVQGWWYQTVHSLLIMVGFFRPSHPVVVLFCCCPSLAWVTVGI
jgi:hypothetical protein